MRIDVAKIGWKMHKQFYDYAKGLKTSKCKAKTAQ